MASTMLLSEYLEGAFYNMTFSNKKKCRKMIKELDGILSNGPQNVCTMVSYSPKLNHPYYIVSG